VDWAGEGWEAWRWAGEGWEAWRWAGEGWEAWGWAGEGEGEVWGTEVVGCNYFQSIESGRQGQQQVRQCSSAAFAANQ
jgi:hypothetical protein